MCDTRMNVKFYVDLFLTKGKGKNTKDNTRNIFTDDKII